MSSLVSLLTDEDVRGAIVAGIRLHHPEIDLIDVRDVGLDSTPDDVILEWAVLRGRVVVTQDVKSMAPLAERLVRQGLPMPGMIVAHLRCPVGRAVREIAGLVHRSPTEPLDGQILHLPLDKGWRVMEDEPQWAVAEA